MYHSNWFCRGILELKPFETPILLLLLVTDSVSLYFVTCLQRTNLPFQHGTRDCKSLDLNWDFFDSMPFCLFVLQGLKLWRPRSEWPRCPQGAVRWALAEARLSPTSPLPTAKSMAGQRAHLPPTMAVSIGLYYSGAHTPARLTP